MRALLLCLFLSGCASEWDRKLDGECKRLMAGDAFDRASAQRLGCYD